MVTEKKRAKKIESSSSYGDSDCEISSEDESSKTDEEEEDEQEEQLRLMTEEEKEHGEEYQTMSVNE